MRLTDFVEIFVQPMGETVYFLLFILLCLMALLMAFSQRQRQDDDRTLHRYSFALIVIVGMWLGIMVGRAGSIIDESLLPLLEASASILTLVLVGWAFVAVSNLRMIAHAFAAIVSLIVIVGTALGGASWLDQANDVFVTSRYGEIWFGIGLSLGVGLLLGTALTLKQAVDVPLKLFAMGLLVAAYGVAFANSHNVLMAESNLGIIRGGYLAAMAVLVVLVYRAVIHRLTQHQPIVKSSVVEVMPMSQTPPQPTSELPHPVQSQSAVERESVQLMRALGFMLEDSRSETIPKQIIHAVMEVLKVDVVALLRMKDANYADVEQGFDRFLERDISGMAINLNNQSRLVNSVVNRVQRVLKSQKHEDELRDLYTRLDVEQIGPTYFQPMFREQTLIGVILVGLPYSKRELARAEEELLKGIGVIAGSLLQLSYAATDAQLLAEERAVHAMVNRVSLNQVDNQDVVTARQALQDSLASARGQITDLNKQVVDLKTQLGRERERVVRDMGDAEGTLGASQQITTLDSYQRELRQERDDLALLLQEAQAALRGAVSKDDLLVYREMLDVLQSERDDLFAQRESLNAEIEMLKAQGGGGLPHPDDVANLLEQMESESKRLQLTNLNLRGKLSDVYAQLRTMGIDAEQGGLSVVIHRLSDERDALIMENEALQKALASLEQSPAGANVDERIHVLESTLHNVAADREAALKQRDELQRDMTDLREKLHVLRLRWKDLESQAKQAQAKTRAVQEEKTILQGEILRLNNERSNLVNVRDTLRAEKQALEMEREQLLARMAGDRNRVEVLGEAGIGSLTTMISDLTEQREALEVELHQLQQALTQSQEEIERLNAEAETNLIGEAGAPSTNADLLLGLVQEFRTPMTSIVGYVELLLSESAGILGEMQRKFLQRVYINVQRLEMMLDDLIRVTQLDAGTFKLNPANVNVSDLIEDMITYSANRFREKDLTVNLKIEDGLPTIQTDKDALGQVISQLITNAYLVTPPDSEIGVRVERIPNAKINGHVADSLCITVEDKGGGIHPEDEARVFSRKYRAENPLIQGIGDTGVGLAVAKALIEAQGGRLWIETQENIGNRFSFLLPLATD
jgi:signal transduction histidine kinase